MTSITLIQHRVNMDVRVTTRLVELSDPLKEPRCREGRHPLQGGFPHPLNAAREIQRGTMRTPENYVTLGPALGKLWSTFPFLFLFLENRPFTHRNRRRGRRAARNPGALKAGIPFRGASPTL